MMEQHPLTISDTATSTRNFCCCCGSCTTAFEIHSSHATKRPFLPKSTLVQKQKRQQKYQQYDDDDERKIYPFGKLTQKTTTTTTTTKLWNTSPNGSYGDNQEDDDDDDDDEKFVTTIQWAPKSDDEAPVAGTASASASAAKTTTTTTTTTTIATTTKTASITLIGTAHLSERSNAQVRRIIDEIQPTIVMIELDPSRIHRIGFRSIEEMKGHNNNNNNNNNENVSSSTTRSISRVVATGDDIPLLSEFLSNDPIHQVIEGGGIIGVFVKSYMFVQDTIIEIFTQIARSILTGIYNNMSNEMNANKNGIIDDDDDDDVDSLIPGGEFLAAIKAAQRCPSCHTLILGDRSSTETIRRTAYLAILSGDPLAVMGRLMSSNSKIMNGFDKRVRQELIEKKKRERGQEDDGEGDIVIDNAELQTAVIETMKNDSTIRQRMFTELEQNVPEFTQTFLKERDYIMSQSIIEELMNNRNNIDTDDVKVPQEQGQGKGQGQGQDRVVAVVGLAHVSGIAKRLQESSSI